MANIVLLDNEGVARTYTDIHTATFNTAEGGLVTFTAPEEHNDAWVELQGLLEDYSQEYPITKVETQYGAYYVSSMYDFGVWMTVGPNAYRLIDSGIFYPPCIMGKFICFYGNTNFTSFFNGEQVKGSVYWHDGNPEHAPVYLTGKQGNWQWTTFSDNNKGLYGLSTGSVRCVILFNDSLAAPVILTDFLGTGTSATSFWYATPLSDDCWLLQPSNASCGGSVLFYETGRVVYLEPFKSSCNNLSYTYRLSDNVYALSGYDNSYPLVLINTTAGTANVLLTTGIGEVKHYHVASNTLFCRLSNNTWYFYDLSNDSYASIGSTSHSNQSDVTLLSNGIGILCYKQYQYPYYYVNNWYSPGSSFGNSPYGFSIINFAARTITSVSTSGRYDNTCIYYNGGNLALVINSFPYSYNQSATRSEYTEVAYVVNANTGEYYPMTIDGSQVSVNVRLDLLVLGRNISTTGYSYDCWVTLRPYVFFSDSNTAYITFWNSNNNYRHKLFECILSNNGALSLVHEFTSECIGLTLGGELPSDIKAQLERDNALVAYTNTYDWAYVTGASITGQARLYSGEIIGKYTSSGTGDSYADFAQNTCVLVRPNKPPYIFTKTSWFIEQNRSKHFTNLWPSNEPILNNIYAGVSSAGDLFLIDLDSTNPIIDSFNVLNSESYAPGFIKSSSSFSVPCPSHIYTAGYALRNIKAYDVALDSFTSCKILCMYGSVVLLSDDLSTFLGISAARVTPSSPYNSYPPSFNPYTFINNNSNALCQDAFMFDNAEVLEYNGDISSAEYFIALKSKHTPGLCVEFERRIDTTLTHFTTFYSNIIIGLPVMDGDIPNLVYDFICKTPFRYFYSYTHKRDTSNRNYSAIYDIDTRKGRTLSASYSITVRYQYGYNWLESYTSTEEGDIEIMRPGYPSNNKLFWDESAKQMVEITSSNNE